MVFSDSSDFAPPPGEEDKYVLTKVSRENVQIYHLFENLKLSLSVIYAELIVSSLFSILFPTREDRLNFPYKKIESNCPTRYDEVET